MLSYPLGIAMKKERGWADTAQATEWGEREGGGIADRQDGRVRTDLVRSVRLRRSKGERLPCNGP